MFLTIDLRLGYHQPWVKSYETWKTVFRNRYNHYKFLMMPFRVNNAPVAFMDYVNQIFQPYLDQIMLIFIDDILIYSRTLHEHKEH